MSAHSHSPSAGARHRRPLAITFVLVVTFMVVEIVAGWLTGSLSLLSDAGHMATDALGIGMAWAAVVAANRFSARSGHTFGIYRVEILAALANAGLLLFVATRVIWEALSRLQEPTEVVALPMLAAAIGGLVVNLISRRLLVEGARESINVRGAYAEVLADLAASIGVIVAALVTLLTDSAYADPVVAILIGVMILPRAWKLGAEAVRVLIQAAPAGMDLDQVRTGLAAIPGVVDVHDLHVWTLTSAMEVGTAHLMTDDDDDAHRILDQARALLEEEYGIDHATIQVEPRSHSQCVETSW